METIDHRGFVVCVFQGGDEDLSEIHDLQDNNSLATGQNNKLIYVALEGTDDKYLHPERFLVKNYDASLVNHFMWDGLFMQDEQDKRMWEMIDNFIDNNTQVLIENYDFVEDEPFYDYSGGRE